METKSPMPGLTRRGFLTGVFGLAALAVVGPVGASMARPEGNGGPEPALLLPGVTLGQLRHIGEELNRNCVMKESCVGVVGHWHSYRFITTKRLSTPPKAGGLRFTKNGVEVDPNDYFGPDRVWYKAEEYSI